MIIDNTINSVFEKLFNENSLKIPRYQRDYAWDIENIDGILDTIFDRSNWELYFANAKEQYFIGTLITYQNNNETNIIDGQQRTITFYLLFLSAHNLLQTLINNNEILKIKYEEVKENYSDYNDFFHKMIVLSQTLKKIVNDAKFTLKENDDVILQKLKNNGLIVGSQESNIVNQNYRYLNKTMEQNFNANLQDFINAVEFALNKIVFIQVNVHSYEEAIEIFVSLNSNRKELKIDELLNSLFIKDSDIYEADNTAKRFEHVLNAIEKKYIADYITNVWFLKVGKKIPQNDIYKEITKYLKLHSLSSLEILKELEEFKNSYLLASNINKFDLLDNNAHNHLIDNILDALKDNSMKQLNPVIMNAIRNYETNLISEHDVKEIVLQLFDIYVYSQILNGDKSQNLEAFSKKLVKERVLTCELLTKYISSHYKEMIKQRESNLNTSINISKENKSTWLFVKWKELIINKKLPQSKLNSTTFLKLISDVDTTQNYNMEDQDQYLISTFVFDETKKAKDFGKTYQEKVVFLENNNINAITDIVQLRLQHQKEVSVLSNYLSKYEFEGNTNLS